ncbi:MAG: class I SAM-dependent methyltransferase, partial [Candidatus Bathyarchaeia archaeon]
MADWAHGYNVEVPYTYGYYRETSPQWLRWATYLGGRKPPSGKRIRYLELGCGQGFNLLLHASSHPSMEFLGIDFNPSHIAHAEELVRLSGLTNVKFVEGDFLELEKEWPKEYGTFQYVVLHGIWSWVSKDVRKALINILRKVVVPGGIVYIPYNALPGWLPGSIVRETLLAFKKISQLPASSSA